MFTLAIFISIYSYVIFFLGICHQLSQKNIFVVTIFFVVSVLCIIWKNRKIHIPKDIFFLTIFSLVIVQAAVNLIGALGPELAFDALWYHLTIPKLYLQQNSIFFIPNGLFYYSAMPKLTEMLYLAAIALHSEILAKLIHFSFGILTCFVIYKLSRKYMSKTCSLLAVLIFYSNLVVGWESIAAYIDLARTFFEIMALWQLSKWIDDHKDKTLFGVGIMLGLAITTKILAIGSLFIFCLLIIVELYKRKANIKTLLTKLAMIVIPALIIPLPWFIFSYLNTKNIVYPFFTSLYPTSLSVSLLNPIIFFHDMLMLLTRSADPISPVYIAVLPILLIQLNKQKTKIHYLILYCFLSLIVWYITPRTGGGRFVLPYLPAYSVLAALIISQQKNRVLQRVLIGFVIIVSLISIFYRFIANEKYIPVILHTETKQTFLANHLNFSFGDFYDTDEYFAKHIKSTDTVLFIGFHNLYYVDFPFVLNSDKYFNYIATQNTALPSVFTNWHAIYHNAKTGVTLYKK